MVALRFLGLASVLALASGHASAQMANWQGERFTPSLRECLSALEDGVVLPVEGSGSVWTSHSYVVHSGNIYFVSIENGAIACIGWDM